MHLARLKLNSSQQSRSPADADSPNTPLMQGMEWVAWELNSVVGGLPNAPGGGARGETRWLGGVSGGRRWF